MGIKKKLEMELLLEKSNNVWVTGSVIRVHYEWLHNLHSPFTLFNMWDLTDRKLHSTHYALL